MTTLPPSPFGPLPAASPLPVPTGRTATTLSEFWSGYRAPLPRLALGGAVATGLLGTAVSLVRPGLGLALLAATVWLATAPALVRARRWTDLALAAGSVTLVAVLAWRDSGAVDVLAVLVALATGIVAALGSRTPLGIVVAPVVAVGTAVRAMPWFTRGVSQRLHGRGGAVGRVVVAIGVALALVTVLGALFASADPVFARLVPRLDLRTVPARLVVGLFWLGIAGTVAHAVVTPPPGAALRVPRVRPAGLVEWLVPMLAVAGLTWAFVIVQVGGLVGGTRALLDRTGLTYAQYARQGFGQLLAATALTVLVVAVAAHRAPRESGTARVWTTVAVVALSLGTLGVVASALRRMDLYVAEYGLSQLRVLAGWAELVLGAALLIGIGAAVVWRGTWLPRAVLGLLVVAVLGLAAWNPDARIVVSNLRAPHGTDIAYLSGLSADAVPVLAAHVDAAGVREALSGWTVSHDGWASWNASRAAAARVLAGLGS